MNALNSPFIIPVVALMIPIVAIISGAFTSAQQKRLRADQRMAMLQRGLPLAEIEAALNSGEKSSFLDNSTTAADPMRRIRNSRTSGIVLISIGTGLILFFMLLEVILREREVLVGAAAGLIPFAIGVGFLVDYKLQKRDVLV